MKVDPHEVPDGEQPETPVEELLLRTCFIRMAKTFVTNCVSFFSVWAILTIGSMVFIGQEFMTLLTSVAIVSISFVVTFLGRRD